MAKPKPSKKSMLQPVAGKKLDYSQPPTNGNTIGPEPGKPSS